ncbi:MAG: polysaccharide pyruvyl transferase family protein [Clostridia bacterium]|nr:polysaccharide pyruvyl transferase family protein [Clostridia bacterium]
MKRIGIVTIIDYYNYGNRLQNYALSYLLNNRLKSKAITLEGYADPLIGNDLFKWLKERFALQLCRFPVFNFKKRLNAHMVRWFNFSEWSRKYIPKKRLYSCKQLPYSLNKKFDAFISGSDQVWNYRINNIRLDDFFLLFAEDDKKNAVSASFGVDYLEDTQKDRYRDALIKFRRISVREESGASIVEDLINKEVPVLIDPAMLLSKEEWVLVEKKPCVDVSVPYVLKYYLGDDDSSIDHWAKDNNLLMYELMIDRDMRLYSSGPGEFISLIRNAKLVCSDSFHCILLAILFSVPFIVYERKGSENYMISRLNTLLDKFGFNDRWNYSLKQEKYLSCDFSEVGKVLDKERTRFIEFVKMIIGDK